MMFPRTLHDKAADVLDRADTAGVMLATAESCTGGLLMALLTSFAGCSVVIDRGFMTYSNEAKTEMLGVPARLIRSHGAVSAEVARAMAGQALLRSNADVAVSITGLAGPGGSERKPAGLVYFGLAVTGQETRTEVRRFGDRGREAVRLASMAVALDLLSQGVDLFG